MSDCLARRERIAWLIAAKCVRESLWSSEQALAFVERVVRRGDDDEYEGSIVSNPTGDLLDVPGDITVLRPWLPLVRRMRERGISRGLSVVTVTVVCNHRGHPVCWLEPEAVRIEPHGARGELTRLLEGLAR